MRGVAKLGLAFVAAIHVATAAQAASKPVEQLYAECHKRIVKASGKYREGTPEASAAVEDCVRKRLGRR
ncbi:MAG: hypothetical protein HY056_16830 [Proteobacteria bacterium]|nr:hypothetical protein [Pseudomonadota bacterium]